ncbi:MAG TPA: hypothetical protein PLM53_12835 [Spirochaetota bacterium]|nr:hypothetical protein [Spirochaetota bacterium]HPC40687.1 hypothetical protein [Spirochaetota bacterium]HPL17873.1 hypothetical protein [Spirochaetota bacterium]HQF09405.1 hypothetical protein [Spirochaetota bacterium]HQH97981.1 hypothetical protein [Spirochaetota bacterium]
MAAGLDAGDLGHGVSRRLSEQEKRLQRPEYGTGFSWHSSRCAACGHDLKGHAFRFSVLKTGFIKLALNLPMLLPGKGKQ